MNVNYSNRLINILRIIKTHILNRYSAKLSGYVWLVSEVAAGPVLKTRDRRSEYVHFFATQQVTIVQINRETGV